MDISNRKGMFKISYDYLEDLLTNDELSQEIFKNVVITDIENSFMKKTITYYGFSRNFKFISQGEIIPLYDVIVHKDSQKFSNNKYNIVFKESCNNL